MSKSFPFDTVGHLIREQRQARNLTQQALSAKAGVEQSKLSRIEAGRIKHPNPLELGHIANVLGVSLELYYAAVGYPLPHHGIYADPRDFFPRAYKVAVKRENLPQLEAIVEKEYRKFLAHLSTFSQASIDWERTHGLNEIPRALPLLSGEIVLYEWYELLRILNVTRNQQRNGAASTRQAA
jgi:transcriptional regulator with XRE-family HTH domain